MSLNKIPHVALPSNSYWSGLMIIVMFDRGSGSWAGWGLSHQEEGGVWGAYGWVSLDSTYLSHRNSLNKWYRVDHLEMLVLKAHFMLSFLFFYFIIILFCSPLHPPLSHMCVWTQAHACTGTLAKDRKWSTQSPIWASWARKQPAMEACAESLGWVSGWELLTSQMKPKKWKP